MRFPWSTYLKIFCRDWKTAQKIFVSTKNWLKERLDLEISPDKSKITNLRRNYTEFLGFKLMVKPVRNKYVCYSRMCEKAVKATIKKLKEQVKIIQKKQNSKEVSRLNSKILGSHNYYRKATCISIDFSIINFLVTKSLDARLKSVMSNKPKYSKTYNKLYGEYHGKTRTIQGVTVFPIYACRNKPPMNFSQDICNYTERGRKMIHDKLYGYHSLIKYLLENAVDNNVQYNDNRISLIAGQQGMCYVTNEKLVIGDMECHHKKPVSKGGTDEYCNLVWINSDVHKLVHSTDKEIIEKYLEICNLDDKGLKRVNSLRELVGNSVI